MVASIREKATLAGYADSEVNALIRKIRTTLEDHATNAFGQPTGKEMLVAMLFMDEMVAKKARGTVVDPLEVVTVETPDGRVYTRFK